MRLLLAGLFMAVATAGACGQDSPLADLTVTSTRLNCPSGYAEVTYAYRRGKANSGMLQLEFIVIEIAANPRFKTSVHLSSKVDDVTPPAYIALPDWTVDLPHDHQIHTVNAGRYHSADSDVTLAEIRRWLDQPNVEPSIKSLEAYTAQSRSAVQNTGG